MSNQLLLSSSSLNSSTTSPPSFASKLKNFSFTSSLSMNGRRTVDNNSVNFTISEAAASLSAGLHRRNFHRRENHTARTRGVSRANIEEFAEFSNLSNPTDNNHEDSLSLQHRGSSSSSSNKDCCCCCCVRPSPSCVERVIHQGAWRTCYIVVVVFNLLLALVEPSSVRTRHLAGNMYGEQTIILCLELVFVIFYLFDGWLRWYAGENVKRDNWLRCRVASLGCIFINVILCLVAPGTMSNFARVLRPVLFIERLRNVRKIAASVLSTLPKVFQILLLLTFWVGFFGVAGFSLFAGVVGPDDVSPTTNTTHGGCEFFQGGTSYVQSMQQRLDVKNATYFACSTFSKIHPDGRP